MANLKRCKECGELYDPEEVRDMAWNTIGYFGPKSMSGRCYDCISEHYAETHDGEYPTDKFEDMDASEEDEWFTDTVLDRIQEGTDLLEGIFDMIGSLIKK